jgi:hypothetical protein
MSKDNNAEFLRAVIPEQGLTEPWSRAAPMLTEEELRSMSLKFGRRCSLLHEVFGNKPSAETDPVQLDLLL